jgi:hypothetical protein
MLEQNPADVMVDVLIFFIKNTANGTHTPYSRSPFSAPSYAVSVNSLFFASLSASIVAALASVVSLQWVAEYDAATSRSGSSPEDRAKRRQFRYGGMEKWKMGEIIAALPILLYFSLVLFFVGLAQWIWSVHTTVGSVVISGMLLGVTFYIVTTMLGVVFPSSPYRAPIVRWIYILFHFIFHPLGNSKQESSDPSQKDVPPPKTSLLSKLDFKRLAQFGRYISNPATYRDSFNRISSTFRSTTLQARDGVNIGIGQKELICDSLSWLAGNISISQDSHHRLLLLAREALKLDKEQQLSKQFKEIPWSLIFRLLGDKYTQEATSRELTEDDEKDLTVLLQCLRNPRIGVFIAPEDNKEYRSSVPGDDTPEKLEPNGPNPAYLLLRNIQLARRTLSIEEQVKLRVGCLNQAHHVPRSLQGGEDFHSRLVLNGTTNMCDYLIPRLAEELESRLHDDDQDRVDTLICLAHLGQPPLQDFQLSLPLYPDVPVQRPSRLIYRILCANWIESQIDHPQLHTILKALVAARRRDSNLKLLWRFIATDKEVEEALPLVDAQDREELSEYLKSGRRMPYLIETLETFDKIIARGCDERQKEVMVELLCHDLPRVDSPLYADYFDGWVKGRIMTLQDPWIRIVGCIATEMYEELDRLPFSLANLPSSLLRLIFRRIFDNRSLDSSPSIWRLRMRLWRKFDRGDMIAVMEQALLSLDELVCNSCYRTTDTHHVIETSSNGVLSAYSGNRLRRRFPTASYTLTFQYRNNNNGGHDNLGRPKLWSCACSSSARRSRRL